MSTKKVSSKVALRQLLREVEKTVSKVQKLREKIKEKVGNWDAKLADLEEDLIRKYAAYKKALESEEKKG